MRKPERNTATRQPKPRRGLRRAIGALAVAATTLSLAACAGGGSTSLLDAIQSGEVTVGTKYDQPGLGERTPDKEFVGLDPDVSRYVIEHIAEKNGWDMPKINFRETPSSQRETFLQNGEVEMITATYSINEGRLKAVDFAGPYVLTHQALLVRKEAGIRGLEDLKAGTKLCSVTGSTPAQKVKSALPDVQLQEFDTYASCAEGVHQGVVDAVTTDATILAGFSERYPGEFALVELKNPDGTYWTDEYYGIGLAKGNEEDQKAVNDAIRELDASGKLAEMVEHNLGDASVIDDSPTIGDFSFTEKN